MRGMTSSVLGATILSDEAVVFATTRVKPAGLALV